MNEGEKGDRRGLMGNRKKNIVCVCVCHLGGVTLSRGEREKRERDIGRLLE